MTPACELVHCPVTELNGTFAARDQGRFAVVTKTGRDAMDAARVRPTHWLATTVQICESRVMVSRTFRSRSGRLCRSAHSTGEGLILYASLMART